jgi:sulfite exporter TauE/SafE
MAQSALIGAFLAGLLGGLHCVAMCGGYVALLSRPGQGTEPLLPLGALRARVAAAHAGRLTTYAVLGFAFGAAGGAAWSTAFGSTQRILYVAANVMLLMLAAAIARGGVSLPALERAGLSVWRLASPVIRPVTQRRGLGGRFALGLLWGITPCGLVYSVLPVALFAGTGLDGALVMLAFGLGTLPSLVTAGWVVGRVGGFLPGRAMKLAGAGLVAGFALFGLWRAAFVPAAIAHGPFCIVP